MKKGIIGKKIGMSQIFDENGNVIPVTIIEAGPCVVAQKKTVETDGYCSVQLGFEDVTEKKLNKAAKGHFKKAGVSLKRHLKEFKLDNAASMNVGDVITADTFVAGDRVDVTGTSKGKGFASIIKKWGFHRGPMGHGSKNHRRPASAGAKGPARIFKGKKMVVLLPDTGERYLSTALFE